MLAICHWMLKRLLYSQSDKNDISWGWKECTLVVEMKKMEKNMIHVLHSPSHGTLFQKRLWGKKNDHEKGQQVLSLESHSSLLVILLLFLLSSVFFLQGLSLDSPLFASFRSLEHTKDEENKNRVQEEIPSVIFSFKRLLLETMKRVMERQLRKDFDSSFCSSCLWSLMEK